MSCVLFLILYIDGDKKYLLKFVLIISLLFVDHYVDRLFVFTGLK